MESQKQLEPKINNNELAIELLKKSFETAQRYLEYGDIDGLKMACAELCVSNAEVRNLLCRNKIKK